MAIPPNLPLIQSYHPTTFLERGVAVPFTTPLLAGARARPAQRGGAELIVPNPSGGRGVYVLPWSGVRELCRPTVHDTRLNEMVTALPSVTPSAIRAAARQIAAQGLAGREARSAAHAASENDKYQRRLANFLLVMSLVDQIEPSGPGDPAPDQEKPEVLEERAKRALAKIAPRFGRPPEQIAIKLEELAAIFSAVGVGRYASQARLARSIEGLCRLRTETQAWSAQHGGDSGAQAAMVADVAELTIGLAQRTAREALALTANVPDLLRQWETAPQPVLGLAARPEWLLDGWEQIALLWGTAENDKGRRAALTEMTVLLPVIPREAADWLGTAYDCEGPARFRKAVSRNEDWRSGGQLLTLIARNEAMRALAA
jgi:hypothetical protein